MTSEKGLIDLSPDWSPEAAERWLAEVRARDVERKLPGWTVHQVKAQLAEAMPTLQRSVKKDRPSSKLGFWPAYRTEWSDIVNQVDSAELERTYAQRNRNRGGASSLEISRMEQACEWPMRYLSSDKFLMERKALSTWLYAEAHDLSWKSVIEATGWFSLATAKRKRAAAFLVICCGLIRDGVRST